MALSGVEGDCYELAPTATGGPAFLVYSSPAYLRHCAALNSEDEACAALHYLAEVYRAARVLWPLNAAAQGETVTVMIDELKSCHMAEVHSNYADGLAWLLFQTTQLSLSFDSPALRF